MKNSEGETLKTKEGETMYEVTLNVGDELIPDYNSIIEKTNEILNTSDGDKKKITNYMIKGKVKDITTGSVMEDQFIKLTPAQATYFKKLIDKGVEINQEKFRVYNYTNDYGTFKGIGMIKNIKPAKTFEELDNKN